MADESTYSDALKAVWGAYLVTIFGKSTEEEFREGKTAVDAAHKAGVKYIVFSSAGGLDKKEAQQIPIWAAKHQISEYIRTKTWTEGYSILSPVGFFENLEMFGRITEGKISSLFKPDMKGPSVSVRDIGDVAALAFAKPESFRGRDTMIVGDVISGDEMASTLSNLTKRPWKYTQVLPPFLQRLLIPRVYPMVQFLESSPMDLTVEIAHLKALKPDMQDFRAWCISKGLVAEKEGKVAYKYAEKKWWGLF
ncbi:NAD(P)-binding protein [Gonapodya prolifera JEL478]|uniref:NAD(P)-binding protein n=1 Tax=Gonapodya prolifera (strain JEL478) TaxID=1344416 RepID=A0A139A631_GONPJ|nr:NAD(P)-binding protein [Gonapodya prolifera JEL478]|eukprot:KXS12211.1 NAD(P)-binding protein [Gonapodya prolifera JEL478]